MAKGIKTRETKKDIRALDKAGVAAERMKNSFVRTKDEAMQTQQDGRDYASPTEYAEDKVTDTADRTVHEAAHQAKKQGAKVIDKVKESRRSGARARQAANRTIKTTAQTEKTIKHSMRLSGKTAKATAKGTVKTAGKSIKTAEHTARTTIKTTQQAAKAAQKTAQATAKAAKMAAQTARAAAKAAAATAKAAVKAMIALVKMAIAAIKSLIAAIAAGGWVAVAVILVICLIGLLLGSVFGIFFSNESGDVSMTEVVTQLNQEFSGRIEQIQEDNPHDHLVLHNSGNTTLAGNWRDVLAIYAVKTAGDEQNGMEVATLDDTKISILCEIFWEMNEISYSVTTTTTPPESITDDPVVEDSGEDEDEDEDEEPVTYTVLSIYVTSKSQAEMRTAYHFTSKQNAMLDELLLPEYQSLFMQLTGSYVNISLSPEELAALMENLPQNLDERRKAVVMAAYSLIGKVNYFWGGKSTVIGWDSRWGTPTTVTSAGSSTTGTVRPFGLDCSGYVTWAFCNAAGSADAADIIKHGTRNQYANSHKISWSELMPGDLVFFDHSSPHVGIIIGKKDNGNVIIAHCASSRNNVVVDEYSGPKSNGFLLPARPYFYD